MCCPSTVFIIAKTIAIVNRKYALTQNLNNRNNQGVITIARKKKPDWNAVKAEYIGGDISQRDLADKYSIPYATLRDKAQAEKWTDARTKARQKGVEKSAQKAAQATADAAAANAVKLEKARAMAIEWVMKSFEQMPKNGGTHVRQTQIDKQTGRQMSIDYDLSALVVALEKLSNGQTADFERQKKFASENNQTLMSYADLFKRPARTRKLEDIEATIDRSGGEANVQD